uniref:Uncharacterized protein n=1 Tax=Caenorhabditis japonica TaxID=281687 RepID=A0A8R1DUR5_CAEJA
MKNKWERDRKDWTVEQKLKEATRQRLKAPEDMCRTLKLALDTKEKKCEELAEQLACSVNKISNITTQLELTENSLDAMKKSSFLSATRSKEASSKGRKEVKILSAEIIMKAFFKKSLKFDVLSSRLSVTNLRKKIDVTGRHNIEIVEKEVLKEGVKTTIRSARCSIKNLATEIRERVENLEKHNLLLATDELTVCLLGDKGSDATKLCVSIEDVANPNSPGNLLLAGMYEG